jgi:hypothetical protein
MRSVPNILEQPKVSSHFKTLKLYRTGWRTLLRARTKIVNNFWRNYFSYPWEFWAAKFGLGVFHRHY